MTSNEARAGGTPALQTVFKPGQVARFLIIVVVLLVLAHIVGRVCVFSGHKYVFGLVQLFDLDSEGNIPTFYSAVTLLFSACLFFLIAKNAQSYSAHWSGLGVIFSYLALDEAAEIHEMITEPLRNLLHTSGLLYSAWIIPYALLGLLVAFAYLKFLFYLPSRTRNLLILSGIIFVSGAAGFEALGELLSQADQEGTFLYAAFVTIEETLEMIGVVLLIYTLLSYIAETFKNFRIGIES